MSGSLSEQFDQVFKSDPKYKGWHFQDFLIPLKVGEYCVINTDDQEIGTHWTGLYRKTPTVYWYFDSYGVLPVQGVATLRNAKTEVIYQSKQLQPINSDKCGEWVATWLLWVRMGLPYEGFLIAYPNEKELLKRD